MTRSITARKRDAQAVVGESGDVRIDSGQVVIRCRWCELPNPDGGTAIKVKFSGPGALAQWADHCQSPAHLGR